MSEILRDMDDRELYETLEKAGLVEKLRSDPAWKMLQEAATRIAERAVMEFALKTDPTDTKKIIMLQTILKKYKVGGLFDEIKMLESESNAIFNEAKQRGLIGGLFHEVMERISK